MQTECILCLLVSVAAQELPSWQDVAEANAVFQTRFRSAYPLHQDLSKKLPLGDEPNELI